MSDDRRQRSGDRRRDDGDDWRQRDRDRRDRDRDRLGSRDRDRDRDRDVRRDRDRDRDRDVRRDRDRDGERNRRPQRDPRPVEARERSRSQDRADRSRFEERDRLRRHESRLRREGRRPDDEPPRDGRDRDDRRDGRDGRPGDRDDRRTRDDRRRDDDHPDDRRTRDDRRDRDGPRDDDRRRRRDADDAERDDGAPTAGAGPTGRRRTVRFGGEAGAPPPLDDSQRKPDADAGTAAANGDGEEETKGPASGPANDGPVAPATTFPLSHTAAPADPTTGCSPVLECGRSVRTAAARVWHALTVKTTGRGLRPLPPFEAPPAAAKAFTTLVQPRCATGATAVCIRIEGLSAAIQDSYVLRPLVRVSFVDSRTGRLLRKTDPTQPAVCASEAATVVHFGSGGSDGNNDVAKLKAAVLDVVPPMATHPMRPAVADPNPNPLVAPGDATGSPTQALPMWNETLLFDVDAATLLRPGVIIMFEIVECGPVLPQPSLKHGGGFYDSSWGFLRPVDDDGTLHFNLEGSLPSDLTPFGAATPPAVDTGGGGDGGSSTQPSALRIAMFNVVQPTWAETEVHLANLYHPTLLSNMMATSGSAPTGPPSAATPAAPTPAPLTEPTVAGEAVTRHGLTLIPCPNVFLQYRMSRRSLAPYTLRASVSIVDAPPSGRVRRRAAMAGEREVGSLQLEQLESEPSSALLGRKSVAGDLLSSPTVASNGAEDGEASQRRRRLRDPCLLPTHNFLSLHSGSNGALRVSFSPDGRSVAVACSDTGSRYPIRLYDVDSGEQLAVLGGHSALVYCLDWSPDSDWLLSSSADGTAMTWNISSAGLSRTQAFRKQTLFHSPPSFVYAARFHPLDPTVAVSGAFDTHVRLWDLGRGDKPSSDRRRDVGPDAGAGAGRRGGDGDEDGDGDRDGDGDGDARTISGPPTMLGILGVRRPHATHVNCVVFDADADHMFTADADGVILIWDAKWEPRVPSAYKVLHEVKDPALAGLPIVSLMPRPNAPHLLVLAHHNVLLLLDLSSRLSLRKYPGVHCERSSITATFSPDGTYVLAGSEHGSAAFFHADTGRALHVSTPDGTPIGFASSCVGVDWHPSQHVVGLCSFGSLSSVVLVAAKNTV